MNGFFGLALLDLIVIGLYFGVVLYIGFRAMKKVKGQEDFFLGGRSFGKFLQTFSMFGQATSAETAVGMSSTVAQKGLAGVFFNVLSGLLTLPFSWFIPLWFRRSRLTTLADLFAERFESRRLATLFSVAQIAMFMTVGAMGLQAMSKTIMAVTPKPQEVLSVEERVEYGEAMQLKELEVKPLDLLSEEERNQLTELRRTSPRTHFSYFNKTLLILVMSAFVILYAAGGGLEAAVRTDAVQSLFIIILTIMMFPFAMIQLNKMGGTSGLVGPFETVHNTLPTSMLELFGSPHLAGFTWYYIVLLSLIGVAGGFAFANNLVVFAAAKDEATARVGALYGILLKRFSTMFWVMLALFILTLYGAEIKDPDLLWGVASKELLPAGFLGLMLACLIAALMSTTDTHMIVVSGLITNNIYKPLAKNRSEKHYLNAGRLFGVVHILGAIAVVLMGSSNLFEMIVLMLMINLTAGPSIMMAFLWRRTNTSGVWASMGGSLLLILFIPMFMSWSPAMRENQALHLEIVPPPVVQTSTAREWDVKAQERQIEKWKALNEVGKAMGERPAALAVGERFEQPFAPPAKAVFWQKGIKLNDDGKAYGDGFFRLELYLLHKLGLDMSRQSIPAIESISMVFKLVFPFAALLLFGWFGRPNNEAVLDQFYGRLLTPAEGTREQDAHEVDLTIANPKRFDDRKLWPNSNWYIRKWDWQDWKGIVIVAVAFIVIGGLMMILANLGR
jgi:solute:Na+ symporter, SSS family